MIGIEQMKKTRANLTPEENAQLDELLSVEPARDWIPHKPHGRQKLFLDDLADEYEVLYGGAAGGMKSDALLQAALQYVDVPHYAALILRRSFTDLSKPGALLDRAREWLANTEAYSSDGGKTWVFPSGAILAFGYIETEGDKYNYQSAEYQFVGFDELTQFGESQYVYMFSRLRRPAIPCCNCFAIMRKDGERWIHANETDCDKPVPEPDSLKRNGALYDIPLRMRAASNPGGEGHEWVKERFIPENYAGPDEPRVWEKEGEDEEGAVFHVYFVPSRVQDNPFLDQEGYIRGLGRLDRVTGRQLLHGDWAISATGSCYFHLDALMLFERVNPVVGELQLIENGFNESHLAFVAKPFGLLAIWRKPEKGHFYCIGADTATGKDSLKGKTAKPSRDWSVAIVRDIETGEQVARLRGQISERFFGEYWARLSKWYNDAYLVPAVTGGYGRAALNRALDCGLPIECIYAQEDESGLPNKRVAPVDLGFTETSVTRQTLYSGLEIAIIEHAIETYDAVTINEYFSFEINKDGKPEGRTGTKDDCVTADALCLRGMKYAQRYVREMLEARKSTTRQLPQFYNQQPMTERELNAHRDRLRRINSTKRSRQG